MNLKRSYTMYSIACFVVWAVILTVVSITASADRRHVFYYVAAGWLIGWVSATIARAVYPPPKPRSR
jgi:hypothetical protein